MHKLWNDNENVIKSSMHKNKKKCRTTSLTLKKIVIHSKLQHHVTNPIITWCYNLHGLSPPHRRNQKNKIAQYLCTSNDESATTTGFMVHMASCKPWSRWENGKWQKRIKQKRINLNHLQCSHLVYVSWKMCRFCQSPWTAEAKGKHRRK